jgi:hypothetical protein
MAFFLAELGTTGSIDGSERFLIRGKYPPKCVLRGPRGHLPSRSPLAAQRPGPGQRTLAHFY